MIAAFKKGNSSVPPVLPVPSTPAAGVVLIDLPTWSRRLTATLLNEVPEHLLADVQTALASVRWFATLCDRLGIVCRVPPPTSTPNIELAIMSWVDCMNELFQANAEGEDSHSIERRRLASGVHRAVRALRPVLKRTVVSA